MNLVTFDQMRRDVQQFAACFRGQIDLVVGQPRSGTLIANLMALHLNIPCGTTQDLQNGTPWASGPRYRSALPTRPRVLIVDDSALSGNTIQSSVAFAGVFPAYQTVGIGVLYASRAVAEAWDKISTRHYLSVVDSPRLFAWNYAHANATKHVLFDFDGVFCEDPPVVEDDEAGYVDAIQKVAPILIPTWPIRGVVTHRLEKRRQLTERWMLKHGFTNPLPPLTMRPEGDCKARRAKGDQDGTWKGEVYKRDAGALLFVESCPRQASRIAGVADKPVYCPATDTVFR